MARKSYFEEKRSQYSNPNFFNTGNSLNDIANNVKRIIKDVKFGLISDEDYVYFQNNNVINVCTQVAYKNSVEAMTCANALQFYINMGLNKGYSPVGYEQLGELTNATNAYNTFSRRAYTWMEIYKMFTAVRSGYDVRSCLQFIVNIDNGDINNL